MIGLYRPTTTYVYKVKYNSDSGKTERTENPNSKRSFTRKYVFPIHNESKVEVCKTVFKHTLRISDQRIAYALDKETVVDKRDKHEPHNKLSNASRNEIKDFIKKFPFYESHYTRKENTNRRYLSPSLNITLMYKLYANYCSQHTVNAASEYVFRQVFNSDFNLHFHPPLKETYKTWNSFKNKLDYLENEEEKQNIKEKHNEHLCLAERARENMNSDIDLSKESDNTYVISFD